MSSPENITDFEQYQDEFSETDNVIVNNSPKQFMYAYTSLNCIAILASIALIAAIKLEKYIYAIGIFAVFLGFINFTLGVVAIVIYPRTEDVTSTVLDVLLIRDLAFWILHVFILIGVSCYYIIKDYRRGGLSDYNNL